MWQIIELWDGCPGDVVALAESYDDAVAVVARFFPTRHPQLDYGIVHPETGRLVSFVVEVHP